MEINQITDKLVHFGMTRQEAFIYTVLHKSTGLTGYEVAKQTGISRSNAYSGLSSLVDKGAAYVIESGVTKYICVGIEEFCNNKIRNLTLEKDFLIQNMPQIKEAEEGYITITGDGHILDKMHNILLSAEKRIYISMSNKYLKHILDDLTRLLNKNIKLIILTNKNIIIEGAKIYITENKENQVGIITDSQNVLTGEYGLGTDSTCLYSGQKNFVRLFKDSMRNEIKLLEITKTDRQ